MRKIARFLRRLIRFLRGRKRIRLLPCFYSNDVVFVRLSQRRSRVYRLTREHCPWQRELPPGWQN